ncbi:MAG: hypothetical protein R3F14_07980 [Polyangiaceae bacterium]
MTVRRASFFALIGLVFAFWYAAVGCNLDATGYGDVNGEPCTVDVHCDDGNACTLDECNADGVCIHTAEPDGTLPDGVKGNCKILECNGGVETEVYLADDVDDGNDCTDDDCSESLGATHTPKPGSPCDFKGGLGVCDGDGVCNAKCGYIGDDGNEVGCAPSENECSPSYCDKSKGICVTESLDGVPVPGSNPATDCGGSFCVAGVAEDQFAAAGAPCVGMTGGTQGTVCDGQGACVECVTAANCNPDDHTMGFCFTAMCVNNTCMVDAKDDGTVLPDAQQKMGDCQEKRCFGFEAVDVPLNSDLPEDNNDCTFNVCTNGVPTNPPTPANTGCGLNGALFCDGAGQCSDCVSAGQCGVDTDCLKWACTNNTCQMNFEADNTPLPAGKQTPADCLLTVCNGAGNTKNIPEDGDLPNDNNDCTSNQCMNGMQVFPPVSAGATCLGNRVCDMSGNCLGGACLGAGDCPGGAPCVDGVCCSSACNTVCEACTIALKGSGLQGQCGVSMPGTNSPNDCPNPKVCNGMTGAAACKLPVGQACSLGSECLLGFCTDGVCCGTPCGGVCEVCNAAGTCSNIPNGQDPDNECPGVVNCSGLGTCGNLLPNGTACSMASECQSNNCVDGVCCNVACGGNCQACNLGGAANGTCTNIPKEQDPANECAGALVCDGMGACKSPQGTTCGAASNCASGFCVDGVCCDTVCGTTCKACNLAGNVGTCTNIANGQDPANECPGATSCGGSGSCVLFTNGTPCATGTECSSGNCVDGVCCNTGCGTACKACNLAGNTGTCTNITSGQDPANECNGAQVCNGAGACQGGPNGASCAMASECLSGNCVDGVCCNTSCGGTCKACNLGATRARAPTSRTGRIRRTSAPARRAATAAGAARCWPTVARPARRARSARAATASTACAAAPRAQAHARHATCRAAPGRARRCLRATIRRTSAWVATATARGRARQRTGWPARRVRSASAATASTACAATARARARARRAMCRAASGRAPTSRTGRIRRRSAPASRRATEPARARCCRRAPCAARRASAPTACASMATAATRRAPAARASRATWTASRASAPTSSDPTPTTSARAPRSAPRPTCAWRSTAAPAPVPPTA